MGKTKKTDKVSIKSIIYASSGTVLEWYNFSIYAYIAVIISTIFFPHGDEIVAIISSFGIFAASYLIRPLGGAFFGSLGDRIGRKKVLIFSIVLMGISVLIIGSLPTFHTIGYAAPILLTIAMLLQGFSMGGQFSGVQVMLLEQAGENRRGLVSAFGTLVSGCGVLLSTLVLTILTSVLSKDAMLEWGWRLPFFLGALMSIYIIILQLKMEESPHFEKLKKNKSLAKAPVRELFKYSKSKLAIAIFIIGYSSLAYYMIAVFLPTFLTSIVGLKSSTVMAITTLSIGIYAFTAPLWGYISDKVGRRPVLFTAVLIEAICIYPMFYLFIHGNVFLVCVALLILMLPISAYASTCCSAVNEQFSTKERYSGGSIGINIGVAIGGLTPLISTELIHVTKSNMSPAILLLIGAVIILYVIYKMKETSGKELEEV
jgi:MFS transporter, MHS family, proline/betaine transporter